MAQWRRGSRRSRLGFIGKKKELLRARRKKFRLRAFDYYSDERPRPEIEEFFANEKDAVARAGQVHSWDVDGWAVLVEKKRGRYWQDYYSCEVPRPNHGRACDYTAYREDEVPSDWWDD